ncbi:hypothetical protein BD289DRAFT_441437 [Coniella lustricola]|uniref:Transmembrane protein n=1 Tax=Coniella lustricola TaxID=2025994 RepID=A0A2T2ZZH0_9PEZI|nr:hypothetical protein BD289DRAFT_441437 [Coniella lustricola]
MCLQTQLVSLHQITARSPQPIRPIDPLLTMAIPPHQSWFHYSLERPYPFRWFTPLFASLAVAFAVLFTFINLAADGYTQKVVYTTNPNSTLDEHYWYMHAPWSWISTAQFSCQSPGITIGSPYYTSNQNTASYTVTNMNTSLPSADGGDGGEVYAGLDAQSLGVTTYLNNTFRDCEMGTMEVIFTSDQEPSTAKVQIQTGPIYCHVETEKIVNFTVQQSFSGTEFLFDQRSSLSQYLIYNFMKESYTALMDVIYAMNSTAEYTGTTLFLQTSGSSDITSNDFFIASVLSPGQSANLISSPSGDHNTTTATTFPLAQGTPSNLAQLLDAFAKSYYSTVMWDLNFNSTINAFANASATQYLQNTVNGGALSGDPNPIANLSILGTSELQGQPAQFSVQYICSVPRQKDTGSLIVSVAVANIVLLSAFWKLFETVARRWLIAKDRNWNVCPGCLESGGALDGRGAGSGTRQGPRRNRWILRMGGTGNESQIWHLDQDPLCQNGDADQETLYGSQSKHSVDKVDEHSTYSPRHSIKTRDSQGTIHTVTLEEKDARKGKIVAGEYLALS